MPFHLVGTFRSKIIDTRDNQNHVSEEQLEQYAMRTLAESGLERLEQHLLVCPVCRLESTEMERYIRAMQSAGTKIKMPKKKIAALSRSLGTLDASSLRNLYFDICLHFQDGNKGKGTFSR